MKNLNAPAVKLREFFVAEVVFSSRISTVENYLLKVEI